MPYQHHFSHYHLPRLKEMGRIFWCHSVSAFGISLAAIFVPLFLLKIGYGFSEVLFFLLAQQILALLFQVPASKLLSRISPHHMLAIGTLLQCGFFGFLITLENPNQPLIYLAIFWALNRSIYWAAFHYVFGESRAHAQSGRQVAGINALIIFSATAAPAIGGITASAFGINYVYFIAVAFLVAAVLPMLKANQGPACVKLAMPISKIKLMRRDGLANFFNGMVVMSEVYIWPILIYLLVDSYAGVGVMSSLIAFVSVFVTLYAGKRLDSGKAGNYLKRGLGTYSLTSLGRALAQSGSHVFGLNVLGGIGRSLYITPFMNKYYTNSDGSFRLGYITVMEASFSLGAAIYLAALLILAAFLSVKIVLAAGLVIVAGGALGVRLIR